jgi:hypothetical protein
MTQTTKFHIHFDLQKDGARTKWQLQQDWYVINEKEKRTEPTPKHRLAAHDPFPIIIVPVSLLMVEV